MDCRHDNIEGFYIVNPKGKNSFNEECQDCGNISKGNYERN